MASRLFATNLEVIDDVLDLGYIRDGMTVMEPSAGSGAIAVRILERYECEMTAVEIRPELAEMIPPPSTVICSDVFKADIGKFDCIITNPPFEKFQKFVEMGREHLKPDGKVILLLRITLLAGVARYSWIQEYMPESIHLLSRRPRFNGAERVDVCAYAWVVWGAENPGYPTEFRWISPHGRQGVRLSSGR